VILKGARPKVREATIETAREAAAFVTVMTCDAAAAAPVLSVTVRVAEKSPSDVYV
jgi:hypothetical protein